jgi:membrane protease YdiL (CAAX protease family)
VTGGPITAASLLSSRTQTQVAIALTIAAVLALALAWELVRRGRYGVWAVIPWILGLLAGLALVTVSVPVSTEFRALAALGIGFGVGAALYGATAAFMLTVGRWPLLAHQAKAVYELRGGLPVPAAAFLGALIVAPSEEIVWRGVVQPLLSGWWGAAAGAAVAWALYLAVNAVPRSVPILLGAVVGGAVWTALAWWTGGVAASIGCHIVWTCLMIVRPPLPRAAR